MIPALQTRKILCAVAILLACVAAPFGIRTTFSAAPVAQTESAATPDIPAPDVLPNLGKKSTLRIESAVTPEVQKGIILFELPTNTSSGDHGNASPKNTVQTSQVSTAGNTATTTQGSQEVVGPNLIPNPSFESSSVPVGWNKGGYGTNTRTFDFPVGGFDGTNAARVTLANYASGDAKWYFNDVPITGGHTYQFSDYSFSNISSIIDVRFKLSDGSYSYRDIATVAPSSSYQNTTTRFVAPSNAVSLTIFHLINQNGILTTDAYALNEITTTPVVTSNLIPNPDFETAGTSGNPANWNRGRWGTNDAIFSYPASGVGGSRGAKISISNYTSGDAKWYFTPLSLDPGVYSFSDSYVGSGTSYLSVQYQNADGSFSYVDLGFVPSSPNSFSSVSANFTIPANVRTVTVFPLIKSAGALTIDNADLEYKSALNGIFATGAVTLTFDDGLLSQYQNAVPKLNSAGLKASFFIITRQLSDYGYPGFMSKAQIAQIYGSGHEIGAHTRTHPYLSQLSASQQQDEIAGSRQDLLAMNVGPIVSFAYPYGDYNATTLQIVKDAGFLGARNSSQGYVMPTSDRYQATRFSVEASTTVAQVKQWIDTAVANKVWLILTLHAVDLSGGQYSTTPDTFNQIVDYLVSKGVRVVTLGDGMKDMNP